MIEIREFLSFLNLSRRTKSIYLRNIFLINLRKHHCAKRIKDLYIFRISYLKRELILKTHLRKKLNVNLVIRCSSTQRLKINLKFKNKGILII
jgi:hypothetical protein